MVRSVPVALALLILCAGSLLPAGARAQHTVTDAEAGKLTFASLIARPIPRATSRPVLRDLYRPTFAVRRVSAQQSLRRPSRVSRLTHVSRLRHSHRGHAHLHSSRR